MATATATDAIKVALPHGRHYYLHFAALSALPRLMQERGLRRGPCLVITDNQVADRYLPGLVQSLATGGWQPHAIVVAPGEVSKDLAVLQHIYDEALGQGIDRKTPIVALGGGVVGDLAGFAAATLLRGLPLVQAPTTLVAQVDSAIGGKTGVNHTAGKNLVGAFYQPALTCADPSTLASLTDVDWASGLAEVVKHALIADRAFAAFLEHHWPSILARDPESVQAIVPWAASIKARIVAEDEREEGKRAILNFGHTFGHAIEHAAGYGFFTHGEAVALGMRAALKLSHLLHNDFQFEPALELVRRIPVRASLSSISVTRLMDAMRSDKKVLAGRQRLIVLREIGQAYLSGDASSAEIRIAWDWARA